MKMLVTCVHISAIQEKVTHDITYLYHQFKHLGAKMMLDRFSPGTAPIRNCTDKINISTCTPVTHCDHTMDLGVVCKSHDQVVNIIRNRTIEQTLQNCPTQPPTVTNCSTQVYTEITDRVGSDTPSTASTTKSGIPITKPILITFDESISTTKTIFIDDQNNCLCQTDAMSGQSQVTENPNCGQCDIVSIVLGVLVGLLTALLVTLLVSCTAIIRRNKLLKQQRTTR